MYYLPQLNSPSIVIFLLMTTVYQGDEVSQLKKKLKEVEQTASAKDEEIEELKQQNDKLISSSLETQLKDVQEELEATKVCLSYLISTYVCTYAFTFSLV